MKHTDKQWKNALCCAILALIGLCGHALAEDIAPTLLAPGEAAPEGRYLAYDVFHEGGGAESMAANTEEDGSVWLTCGEDTVLLQREAAGYEAYRVDEEGYLSPLGEAECARYLREQQDSLLYYADEHRARWDAAEMARLGLAREDSGEALAARLETIKDREGKI